MSKYVHSGPVDCSTAVITGGANGIGEAYVRALHSLIHGCICTVVIGDLDEKKGKQITSEVLGTLFVKCDTTNWDDQVNLFKSAAEAAPDGRISYVIANAGVARRDEVFSFSGADQEPIKPDLSIVDINVNGSLFTTNLALHYFVRQNGQTYSASKWAMRGIMHSMRRTAYYYGSRVNVISPWYVRTNILSKEAFQHVEDVGVQFAEAEDAGRCLLRILGDKTVNGHSFFISARKWASQGFIDFDIDDHADNELIVAIQKDQLLSAPVENGLFIV
ncbi:putative short chain dehydrogenase/ reductase [Truncatella angustata]|uniref:Short chain dehydrogenase/ reductase n=1 Tax=Truncatella angustata TaxID=152316 RepID=A0A9P8ZXV2_9PEZI|nr:putative short chain dehydrogenase/ reductase [Truncatella angustata]KAH6653359.1 putative short chain dehydrogenase/ reductase [Truncatella angustata]